MKVTIIRGPHTDERIQQAYRILARIIREERLKMDSVYPSKGFSYKMNSK